MKSNWIAFVFAACVALGGLTYAFLHGPPPSEPAEVETVRTAKGVTEVDYSAAPSVHVDDLYEDLETHTGQITLQGVVVGSDAEKGVFGVIDLREYEECGVLSCAKFTMPVRFSGDLPEAKTILRMTGEVVKTGDGYLFDAQELEINP